MLYEKLLSENYDVVYYDKLIVSQYSNDLKNFIMDCEVIVIAHDTNEFDGIDLKNKIVINPWGVKI
jgi:hypothetical protein